MTSRQPSLFKGTRMGKMDGETAVIGTTDYSQKSLHEVVYVETPKVDRQIKQFQSIRSVESVKPVSDILTPVSGRIIEINTELAESPELIMRNFMGKGGLQKFNRQTLMKI